MHINCQFNNIFNSIFASSKNNSYLCIVFMTKCDSVLTLNKT